MTTGPNQSGDNAIAAGGHIPAPRAPGALGAGRGPTVGLVTAIPEEFVAMRALLDDTAEAYVAHEPALYALGTLPTRETGQSHGAVLTLLGATATNAAANGCANLVRSFPSLIVVIMVGIAAGVPN